MKVMLAATVDSVEQLRYPLLGSPKLDGVRAIVIDGVVYSRNMKPPFMSKSRGPNISSMIIRFSI